MVQSNESNLHVQNVWMHLPQYHCEDCSNPWPRRLHLVTRIALALAMRNTRWTFKSDSAMLSLRSVQDCSSKCRHGCDSSWVHMIPPVWICIVSKRLVQAKQAEMSQHEHQRCPNEAWCLHENWNATIYVYVYILFVHSFWSSSVHLPSSAMLKCCVSCDLFHIAWECDLFDTICRNCPAGMADCAQPARNSSPRMCPKMVHTHAYPPKGQL